MSNAPAKPKRPKKQFPYVSSYMDIRDKLRWRFRRKGLDTQTRLSFGTPEWQAWYASALAGVKRAVGVERSVPGTFNALIAAYYGSSSFSALKPSTQSSRRGEIERFRAEDGHLEVAELKARNIRRMMDAKAKTPSAANNLLKTLRSLLEFAVEREWIEHNEASKVKKLKVRSAGFHTWSEDEVAQFEARWPVGTKQRLALDLLQYTGQRSADVRVMTRGQIRDGTISLRQSKTAKALVLPVHPSLSASIDAHGSKGLLLLETQFGGAYSAKGFGNWFSAAARSAGLKDCTAHGLRKVAAVRMAEAGCTAHEIMAVTGHASIKEVDRYTQAADQKANARTAMSKVQRAQRRALSAT